jgi:hypothetical protein
MIIYDFICHREHVFEGWFKNSDAMNEQLKKGMITCPVCDSKKINIKPSTFGIAKRSQEETKGEKAINPYHFYKAVRQFIDQNFEDVGPKFAEIALKMHWGDMEKKNIKGTATESEEKELIEEGVPFFKLNLPKFND